jgi:hypothetical protein
MSGIIFFPNIRGKTFISQNTVKESARRIIDDAEKRMAAGIWDAAKAIAICKQVDLEMMGGPCPKCGKPFQQICVDSDDGKYDYYEPACKCFPKCEVVLRRDAKKQLMTTIGCGNWKIAETLINAPYCFNCRPRYVEDERELQENNKPIISKPGGLLV